MGALKVETKPVFDWLSREYRSRKSCQSAFELMLTDHCDNYFLVGIKRGKSLDMLKKSLEPYTGYKLDLLAHDRSGAFFLSLSMSLLEKIRKFLVVVSFLDGRVSCYICLLLVTLTPSDSHYLSCMDLWMYGWSPSGIDHCPTTTVARTWFLLRPIGGFSCVQ